MRVYSDELHINVGCGEDLTIVELAGLVCKTVGFDGEIVCDPSKPDGTPRKLLSIERLQRLGWSPRIGLVEGIADAYRAFLQGAGFYPSAVRGGAHAVQLRSHLVACGHWRNHRHIAIVNE